MSPGQVGESDAEAPSASDFVEDGRIQTGALLGLFVSAIIYAWSEGVVTFIVVVYDGLAGLLTSIAEGWIDLLREPFEFNTALWEESWSIAGAAVEPFGILAFPAGMLVVVAFVFVTERLFRALTEAS